MSEISSAESAGVPSKGEQAIAMSPEQERAAMADASRGVEPADEGVGVLTDEAGDDHTAN